MHTHTLLAAVTRAAAVVAIFAGLAGCAATSQNTPAGPATATACPKGVVDGTRCFSGQDSAGAYYLIAIPAKWEAPTGVLVMHAHGGPELGAAKPERAVEDLERWSVTVKAGYAWAGSTYRRGGYGVTMAAEDTERLRQLFVQQFGQPRRTILHGQSYGGGVASKAAEMYAAPGQKSPYDGVLLTSGVLGGGTNAYDFRLDLRVVYQYICKNHPLPTEPQYPLWMGLPKDSTLTRAGLASRVQQCTGVGKPMAERSPDQRARLQAILDVVKIPEKTFVAHLNWATWLFQDMVQERLGGRNPFGNMDVKYTGSADDVPLNAGVLRYAADPQAVALLAKDSNVTGRVGVPVLTMHAINDPTAFVELESVYRNIFEKAGNSNMLVQTFSTEAEHSYLSEPAYPALFASLLDWIDKGVKPSPQSVAQRCSTYEAGFGGHCHFNVGYQPKPLDTRVAPRVR